VDFCGLSDLTAIVFASNQLRLFHAIGNGIQVLPPVPVVNHLLVSGNSLTSISLLTTNVNNPLTFDFSYNALINIPPISPFFRLFDVTENSVWNLPDSAFERFSRISFTDNPISRAFDDASPELSVIEEIDIVEIDIRIASFGRAMQELVRTFRGDESRDTRLLHFDADASIVYAEMISRCQRMEDAMIVRQHYRGDNAFDGVFDSHGGDRTACYAAAAFPALFADKPRHRPP
jgi:Leucine-rich repeat (LRR) protein